MATRSITVLLIAMMALTMLVPASALPGPAGPSPRVEVDGPWWSSWASDADGNGVHDWLEELAEEAMARGPEARLDVVVDLDRTPVRADVERLEALGMEVHYMSRHVDAVLGSLPAPSLGAARALPGVVMLEAQGRGYPLLESAGHSVAVHLAHESLGYDGEGVTVAVLDTGVNADHKSLDDLDDDGITDDPKLVVFYDAYTNTTVPPYDSGEHGTWVAGIAVGTGGNSKNVGSAPGAKLVGVRIGSTGGFPEHTALRGIEWTIDNRETYNISVMVCSWGIVLGGPNDHNGNSAISRAADEAVAAGINVVVAAGNSALSATVTAPGDAHAVVTVGSVNDDHALSSFSSEGPTTDGRTKPDVCAPGESVTAPYSRNDGGWYTGDGTSASAPLVGGIIAMMLEANPYLTPPQVKQVLHETSEHNTARAPKYLFTPNNGYGWGVVHATGAVSRARDLRPPTVDLPVNLESGQVLALEMRGHYTRTAWTEYGENGESFLGEDEVIVEGTVPADWERPTMVTYEMEGDLLATVVPEPVTREGDDWQLRATFRVRTDVSSLTVGYPTIRFETSTPVISQAETYTLNTQAHLNGMSGEAGRIRVSVGGNVPPEIGLVMPDGGPDTADTFYVVRWTDDDPDDNARISLYNDQDTDPSNGRVLIVEGLPEDPEGDEDSYLWDTSTLVDGRSFYVQAVIDDGVNEARSVYSTGTVTIDHAGANSPPSVEVEEPDGLQDVADEVYTIEYVATDPDDVAHVSLYWDTDDQGFDGTTIVRDLEEADGPGRYAWDTSRMEDGLQVFVYAIVSDGQNPQARAYSEGRLTIEHDTGPEVSGHLPVGQDVPLDEPVVITFDREMDQDATQGATSIAPAVVGTYSWSDDSMVFEPGGGWSPETRYTVTVDEGAMDADGVPLERPYQWSFTTEGATQPIDPPRVGITSPSEGDAVSGLVWIEGTAAGLGPDGLVEVRVDGGEWRNAEGTSQWQLPWNTRNVDDGYHTISARGKTALGATGPVATVNVTVGNEAGSPPGIDPIPDMQVSVGEEVHFQVTASDPDGDDLVFSDDTGLFDINPATGEVSFTPSEDQVGEHLVRVTVFDGESRTYAEFILTVEPKGEGVLGTLPISPAQAMAGLALVVLLVLALGLAMRRSRRRSEPA